MSQDFGVVEKMLYQTSEPHNFPRTSSYFTKVREERARGKTSEQRRISHIPRLHGGTPLSCHPLLSLNITEKIESPIEFAGKDLEPHSKCKLLNKLQHLISLLSRCSFYKS
ncbi:uncharacterized protein LOC116186037 [Apis dorsata]|uniref:uncharacterized protein LOC116186037 n=1 Tax=Apis dorsata TaxID=7462 RepID=UPI0012933FA9|nr:uncharacterized protein LOC116186037 [Apis dorsata]